MRNRSAVLQTEVAPGVDLGTGGGFAVHPDLRIRIEQEAAQADREPVVERVTGLGLHGRSHRGQQDRSGGQPESTLPGE